MIKCNKSMVVRFWSAMVSRFCVWPTSKRWLSKTIQVIMTHDPFDVMYKSMKTYNIHLAFTYSIDPSSAMWSKLVRALPFPPMRVVEVQWSCALSLMCECGPSSGSLRVWVQETWGPKHSPLNVCSFWIQYWKIEFKLSLEWYFLKWGLPTFGMMAMSH
jgi:hypothetical protein